MPASAHASTITGRRARPRRDRGDLENSVWAMPTMAVASRKATAGLIEQSSQPSIWLPRVVCRMPRWMPAPVGSGTLGKASSAALLAGVPSGS